MRSQFKNITALLLCVFLTLCFAASAASPADYEVAHPENLIGDYLYGQSCIVINADTGDVLFSKNADARRYPASTTKIVTCILALEWAERNGTLGRTVVIPTGVTVDSEQSRMGLSEGDTMTFEDLLYGMMIASGNDAAQAVAKIVAGSTSEYVRLMNSFVEGLGITSATTHFSNVTGMHEVNHYTCASDLAKIMAYCLGNETFRQIIGCQEYTVFSEYWPDGKTYTSKYELLDSTNPLYYSWCIGGKSGYTSSAGRSFVGAAVKNDLTLVSVSLNPTDANDNPKDYFEAFTDTIRLFKYGFLQYDFLSFKQLLMDVCSESVRSVQVVRPIVSDEKGGLLEWTVTGIPSEYGESYLKSELKNEERLKEIRQDFASRLSVYYYDGEVDAPVEENEKIGTAEFTGTDGSVYEGTVVALRDVPREPDTADEAFDKWVDSNIPSWVKYLMPRYYPISWLLYIVLAVAIVALIVYTSSRRARKNKRRRAALEAKRREYLRRMQREEYLRRHPEMRKQTSAGKRPASPAGRRPAAPSSQAPRKKTADRQK